MQQTDVPYFICVGAQRAGTTTFFDMIKKHPNVSMSSRKEIHYFDVDQNYKKGSDWYNSFFSQHENNCIRGECTPDYLLYSFVPKRIKDSLGKNVKLLFILRNPIERAYSQFNFHKMMGVEHRDDFFNVINSEEIDKENSLYKKWYDPAYYLSRGLYCNQIKRYFAILPKENMLFILYEDLFGDNQDFHFNKILNFLRLESFQSDETDRENRSMAMVPKKGISKLLFNMLKQNKAIINNSIKKILPTKTYLSIRQQILSKLEKSPDQLSHQKKIILNNDFFAEDILELQKLIHKDLSAWLS